MEIIFKNNSEYKQMKLVKASHFGVVKVTL